MILQPSKAPNIRYRENVHTLFADVVISLIPLLVMSYFYYGPRVVVMAALSVGICTLSDMLCLKMAGKRIRINDFSAVITGLIITLLMPATAPFYAVAAASFFAIIIAKHPFGGLGRNIFNPAAAGVAFALVCWPAKLMVYPKPFEQIHIFANEGLKLSPASADILKLGGEPDGSLLQMFLGNFAGPIGATSILVILTCLAFLIFRRTISWHIPVSLVGAAAAFALLFPRVEINPFKGMMYELFAGCLIFGAVFIASDPVTSPVFPLGKIIYGAGIGVLTMMFRYFGAYGESFLFAVLVMNSLTAAIDRFAVFIKYGLSSDEYLAKEAVKKKERAQKRAAEAKQRELKRIEAEKKRAAEAQIAAAVREQRAARPESKPEKGEKTAAEIIAGQSGRPKSEIIDESKPQKPKASRAEPSPAEKSGADEPPKTIKTVKKQASKRVTTKEGGKNE